MMTELDHPTEDAYQHPPLPRLGFWSGLLLGFLTYEFAMIATIQFAPKDPTSMLPMPVVPWPIYVSTPSVLALIAILSVYFLILGKSRRVSLLVGSGLGIALSAAFNVGILGRAYIGKL